MRLLLISDAYAEKSGGPRYETGARELLGLDHPLVRKLRS